MYTIASTYISGLNTQVEKWLKEDINNIKIIRNLDGLIIYKSNKLISSLPYFNNTFLVLDQQICLGGGELLFSRIN